MSLDNGSLDPSNSSSLASSVGGATYELIVDDSSNFSIVDKDGETVVSPNATFSTVWNNGIAAIKTAGGGILLWRGGQYDKDDVTELNVCSKLTVVIEPNVLFRQTANGGALTKVFRIEEGASKIAFYGNNGRFEATVTRIEMFSNVGDCSDIIITDCDFLGQKGSTPDDSMSMRFGQGAGDVINNVWIMRNNVERWSKGIVTGLNASPEDTLSNIWILQNNVDDTSQEGIRANSIDFGFVIGNKVSNTADNGVDIGLRNTHILCAFNHLYRCGGSSSRGLHTDNGDHLLISNNELIECNDLMIQNSTNVLCIGNYFQAGGSYPQTALGLISIASSTPDQANVFIVNNQINCNDHANADGIQVSDAVDNLIIIGNFIYGINASRTFCSGSSGLSGVDKWVNNYCFTQAGAVVGKLFGGYVAQIDNGLTTEVIPHGLAVAPDVVHVSGSHDEVARCRITGIDGTNITIVASTTMTSNRTIYVTAYSLKGVI